MRRLKLDKQAFLIAVGYAAVSAAWILFSDRAVVALGLEETVAQSAKGLFFVATTAVGLYGVTAGLFASLTQSQRAYRELFDVNPNPMWVYDLQTLRFLAVNAAAVATYGYSPDEFYSMTIADIRPRDDVPALLDNISKVDEGVDDAGLWRHLTKDGSLLWVEIMSHVVEFDGHRAELVMAKDVTGQIEAEAALQETTEQLNTIVRTAPVGIMLVDRETNILYWNRSAEKIFGWRAEEVLGRPNPIITPDDETDYHHRVERVFSGETVLGLEGRRRRADGTWVDVVVYSAPVPDTHGDVKVAVAIFADITERKAGQRQLEEYRDHLEDMVSQRTAELERANADLARATRVKSEFLANMSHELRTPLNAIIGFSDIMLRGMVGEFTDEQRVQISMINDAGRHLLQLLGDVLDLSRIEAGRVEISCEQFDALDVVWEVVRMLEPLARERGLALSVEGAESATITSDPLKVRQIVTNLIGNAVKFTDAGSVAILVSADRGLSVAVADTGQGIPADALEQVFDEFKQVGSANAAKPHGAGLGLAIARKYARMLGGDILAESSVREGSTFTLSLPPRCPLAESAPTAADAEARDD